MGFRLRGLAVTKRGLAPGSASNVDRMKARSTIQYRGRNNQQWYPLVDPIEICYCSMALRALGGERCNNGFWHGSKLEELQRFMAEVPQKEPLQRHYDPISEEHSSRIQKTVRV